MQISFNTINQLGISFIGKNICLFIWEKSFAFSQGLKRAITVGIKMETDLVIRMKKIYLTLEVLNNTEHLSFNGEFTISPQLRNRRC